MASKRAPLSILVLAAGKGTRLRSKTIKLLHGVAGQPMVAHLVRCGLALKPNSLVTVVGYQADAVRTALGDLCDSFVLQKEQRGTGHAVLSAARAIDKRRGSTLLILNGDLPTLKTSTLRRLVNSHHKSGAALSLISATVDDPTGYGRIVRDASGGVQKIVEQKDATADERAINEINNGIYCGDPELLLKVLRGIRPDNAQGEYYITDAVHALLRKGHKVLAVRHPDADELAGVNTRQELAAAATTLYRRKAEQLQDSGVTLLDAERTWIDPRARVGRDTVIYPDVIIEGPSVIGEDCTVRSGCRIVDSRIGKNVLLKDYSLVFESRVSARVHIGPFAHLRPGSLLEPESRVGNFVELKKTRLGRGSKASHLAYLGDAEIGPDCNIGAGTITCNYDGTHKNQTVLGRGVFIGSDSQLIAPVRVRDRAYVAAGSTVTEDVPAGALAIGRGRQKNIAGWVEKREVLKRAKAKSRGKGRKKL